MTRPSEGPRKALGRGLTALLPQRAPDPQPNELPIDSIQPNPLQPRRVFQPDRLRELADSILANGIIQPLVVRQRDGKYQLVAGERRWRAARLAQLTKVPVVVQDISDEHLLEITLVENIQREDLNPIETAQAFQRLQRDLGLSHEEIGRRTGKDRSTITNFLRLLALPSDLQDLVAERRLSQGHARCLLGIPADLQREVAEKAVAQALSVRQLERLTQRMTEGRKAQQPEEPQQDPNVRAAIEQLESTLGTKVRLIQRNSGRGRLEIEFYSPEDLDRIYSAIVKE